MNKQITIRMPKEMLAKWLAALRSGECRRGSWHLESDGAYCCLGVERAVNGGSTRHENGGPRMWPSKIELDAHGITYLDALGVANEIPWLPTLNASAAMANDGKNWGTPVRRHTFAEIADAIEACAEGT